MNTRDILNAAKEELTSLDSHLIDVLDIKRPTSLAYAKQLAKVISKLSPLLGNMIEFSTVDLLNKHDWCNMGEWIVSAKYCYVTHELRLHQNDRCKRFTPV